MILIFFYFINYAANSTIKDSYAGCIHYRELLYSEVAHQLSNQDCITACRWRRFDLAGWVSSHVVLSEMSIIDCNNRLIFL